jgi:hypothetical protein
LHATKRPVPEYQEVRRRGCRPVSFVEAAAVPGGIDTRPGWNIIEPEREGAAVPAAGVDCAGPKTT